LLVLKLFNNDVSNIDAIYASSDVRKTIYCEERTYDVSVDCVPYADTRRRIRRITHKHTHRSASLPSKYGF